MISPSVNFRVSHGMSYVSDFMTQGSSEDVLRGILIAIMMRSARRTYPFANGQILHDEIPMPAIGTSLARRVEGINLQDGRAAPRSLVSEYSEELRPTRVRDCPRKMVVPQHILDLQVLDGNDLVFVNEPCGELLQEVLADVFDMFMDSGDANALLVVVSRTRHLSSKAALLSRKFPLMLVEDVLG